MKQDQIGPLQFIVFSFPTPNFEGKIAEEFKRLNNNEVLRLVDGLAIQKDQQGKIEAYETSQLSLDDATDYGSIIGGMIGLGSGGGMQAAERSARSMAASFHARYEYGLDKDEMQRITDTVPNGSAAILALVEHLWAIPLQDSVRKAGGVVISEVFLTPSTLIALGQTIQPQTASA